jgi:DNA-binding SARP family transcriptional activator
MRWRVLGPLEVRSPEGWVGVGAPKMRALLAALLAEPRWVVSVERLIDELWDGDSVPGGARKLVSQYVFRLRRLIGDHQGQILVTEAPGYRLAAARADVDAGRFEQLVAEARDTLAARAVGPAAALCTEALGLWRGSALADVPRGPLAAAESHRLDELRLAAVELRIEADLGRAYCAATVPELRQLTGTYPLRERFWHLLMRALEDCGRPAEALAAYAQARQVIAGELGVEPGPDLQQLHQRLLSGGASPARHS